jgi:hypothetical protein
MSVCANLEVETTGLSAGTGSTLVTVQGAKAGSNATGLSFQDSWQAQVATEGADTLAQGHPLPEGRGQTSAVADPANCAKARLCLLNAITGFTESARVDPGKSERISTSSSRVRGHQPGAPIESGAGKKSSCDQLAASDIASQFAAANQLVVSPNGAAAPLQQLPGAIAIQNELSSGISATSFTDSMKASSAPFSVIEDSFPPAISTAVATGAAAADAIPVGTPVAGSVTADAAAAGQPISSGGPGAIGRLPVADGHNLGSGDKLQAGDVSTEGNRGLDFDGSVLDRDFPADPVAGTIESKGAKVEERVRLGGEQVASRQLLTDDSGIKMVASQSPEAASLNAAQDAVRSSEAVQPPAGSVTIGESSRSSKSRTTLNANGTQRPTQGAASSSDTFAPHALGLQGNSDTASAGAAAPKTGASVSANARLEETFTALESGTKIDAAGPSLARSGRIQAEVGYQDPTLGWVGVRAEASKGVVHATVLPQSADAAQVLSGHMAGLHSYLADNRTPVETVTLATFGGNGQHLDGQDSGRGMHQGAGQNAGGDNSERILNEQSTTGVFAGGGKEVLGHADADKGFDGRHISVVV